MVVTSRQIGVGFVGAGAAVRSVHIPTLARLAETFLIASVWDIDPSAAQGVAEQTGARAATSLEALLHDPAVEIVVVCTPAALHAEHVIAAMRAGKRAVLCEKPLAATRDEARLIRAAAHETGVPLVVGAMHRFDLAWIEGRKRFAALDAPPTTIRSSIVLPFNDRFERSVTEPLDRPPPQLGDGDVSALLMRLSIMELAIHDIPLIRSLLPVEAAVTVGTATLEQPFGYAIGACVGEQVLDLFARIDAGWHPCWELEAIAPQASLHVTFTPSFVHAGSAVATITTAEGRQVIGPFPRNGYEEEWRALAKCLSGSGDALPSLDEIVGDLDFATELAELCVARLAAGRPS